MIISKIFIFLCLLISVLCYDVSGKTLYVVQHNTVNNLKKFRVVDDKLEFVNQVTFPTHGFGAIDIAVDYKSLTLFICFESKGNGGNIVELYNAKTLKRIKDIALDGPHDYTGLEYDPEKRILYGTDRDSNRVYAFYWNAGDMTLTPHEDNPIYLDNIDYACDLTLNGTTMYVSEFFYASGFGGTAWPKVQAYDVAGDWEHIDTIDMTEPTISIAYNYGNDTIFGTTSSEIVKRTLDPNSVVAKDIGGAMPIGIETDSATGLVYITTYRRGGSIEVWDSSDWTTTQPADPNWAYKYDSQNEDGVTVSNLAGLCLLSKEPELYLEKTAALVNGGTCVRPDDPDRNQIVYTIHYGNLITDPDDPNYLGTVDATITDYLPAGVYPLDAYDKNYDSETHSWAFSVELAPGESDSIDLPVYVTDSAEPRGFVSNRVEIESENCFNVADANVPVCCWGGDVIYVDADATGKETGTNWQDAYTDLQEALQRVRLGCGNEIWVAEGVYKPTDDADFCRATFKLNEKVAVYGGFAGSETQRSQRNWFKNKTVLSGQIEKGRFVDDVVTINDPNEVIVLDGFVITGGMKAAVVCSDDTTAHIEHNRILGNTFGIDCIDYSKPTLRNNWIYCNGTGIYCNGIVYEQTDIRNNTIAYNEYYGIEVSENDPNLVVENCILWGNNDAGEDYYKCIPMYSCINDPADPNGTADRTPDVNGNITSHPMFIFDNEQIEDANMLDFRLYYTSPCIDRGDPCAPNVEETDFDLDERVHDARMDMGADEFARHICYESPADLNGDGIVNLEDFQSVVTAWLNGSGDVNWNPDYDLEPDEMIDLADVNMVVYDWLVMDCETLQQWMAAHPSALNKMMNFE